MAPHCEDCNQHEEPPDRPTCAEQVDGDGHQDRHAEKARSKDRPSEDEPDRRQHRQARDHHCETGAELGGPRDKDDHAARGKTGSTTSVQVLVQGSPSGSITGWVRPGGGGAPATCAHGASEGNRRCRVLGDLNPPAGENRGAVAS
jgi:hypothetical protein